MKKLKNALFLFGIFWGLNEKFLYSQSLAPLDDPNNSALFAVDASANKVNTTAMNNTQDSTAEEPFVEGWQCKFNYKPLFFNCGKMEKPLPKVITPALKAEREILNYLSGKKAQLDARENSLIDKEKELASVEKRVERKLEDYKNALQAMEENRKKQQDAESASFKTLVSYYEKIPPENAAVFINQLDEQTATMLLTRMTPRKASSILGILDPAVAVKLTEKIAKIKENRDAYLSSDFNPNKKK